MDYDSDSDPFGYLDDRVTAFDGRAFGQGEVFGEEEEVLGEGAGEGAAFVDVEDLITARKNEVARIAQANRDAASPEQRELATRLRVAPIQDLHTAHPSSSHAGSCISCARTLADFYKQNGSIIDFAMIDSRWPRFICKHLKVSYRCVDCHGLSLCMHGKEKYRCPICGNGMCRDPTHEIYRKKTLLRKSNCPGCKEAKKKLSGLFKGGSTKRKNYLKKRKYSIKKRKYSIKKRDSKKR